MEHLIPYKSAYLEVNLCISLLSLGFLCFWSIYSPGKFSRFCTQTWGEKEGHLYHVLLRRWIGVLLYGVVPTIVLFSFTSYTWKDYGVIAHFTWATLYWIISLLLLIPMLTYRTAKQSDSLAMYPEIRLPQWNERLLLSSCFAWIAYFFAYELLYRGFLLFACLRAFDVWTAITINTAFYAITHVPKGMKEAIGAIPMGILLCGITISTGSIWLAFIAHTTLSLSNLWFSLKFHPEIQYTSRFLR
ncbi:MAG: CPBP family intramembrane metalloprotease [Saprospiraceae bacterium]|nr:CPBP family intramembrane metalloprotease [Saprospiraceae bacterium]